MQEAYEQGLIVQQRPGERLKRYLDEMPGVSLDRQWVGIDISEKAQADLIAKTPNAGLQDRF